MVLMNARVDTAVPQGNSTYLIRTSVSLNNQQITGLQPDSGDFGRFDADIKYLIEAEFVPYKRWPPANTEDGLRFTSLAWFFVRPSRHFTELFYRGPAPAVGEVRERARVGSDGFLVSSISSGRPSAACRLPSSGPTRIPPIGDAVQRGCDRATPRRARNLVPLCARVRPDWDEPTFDRRLQHRCPIPSEIRPYPLQRRNRSIELRQVRFSIASTIRFCSVAGGIGTRSGL